MPSPSDHFDGTRFVNPHAPTDRSVGDLIRWQRTRQPVAWPEHIALTPHAPPPAQVAAGAAALTFVGHSTFAIRTAADAIVTDPVFTSHAGPLGRFGPRRVRAPGLALESVAPPTLVLVSHNHYDHLQPLSLRALASRGQPTFVAPLGVGAFLRRLGLTRVIELDWWQAADVGASRVT